MELLPYYFLFLLPIFFFISSSICSSSSPFNQASSFSSSLLHLFVGQINASLLHIFNLGRCWWDRYMTGIAYLSLCLHSVDISAMWKVHCYLYIHPFRIAIASTHYWWSWQSQLLDESNYLGSWIFPSRDSALIPYNGTLEINLCTKMFNSRKENWANSWGWRSIRPAYMNSQKLHPPWSLTT